MFCYHANFAEIVFRCAGGSGFLCVLISLGKKVFVLPACYIICFIDVTGSSGLCSLVSMEVLSAG